MNYCSSCYKELKSKEACAPLDIRAASSTTSSPACSPMNISSPQSFLAAAPEAEGEAAEGKAADLAPASLSAFTVVAATAGGSGGGCAPVCPPLEAMDVEAQSQQEEEEEEEDEEEAARPVQKNKKRCFKCRKKVGLVGASTGLCRCEYVFCGMCRAPEDHACDFDWKKRGKDVLSKTVGPKITFTKVDRI